MERVPDVTMKDELSDPEEEGVIQKVIMNTEGKVTHYCHGGMSNEPSESETDKESVVSTSTDRDADPDYVPEELTGQRKSASMTSAPEFADDETTDTASEQSDDEDYTYNAKKKTTLKRPKKRQELLKQSSLKRKKRDESENYLVTCPICEVFIPQYSRHQHLLTHTPTPYECQDCGEKFSTLTTFRRHMYTHKDRFFDPSLILWPDNNNQYKCPYPKCQNTVTTINDHLATDHRPTDNGDRCPVCNVTCTMGHTLKHVQCYPIKCQLCKSFFSGKMMVQHLRSVHGVGKFGWQCRICADHQKFVSVSSLEKHLYTHMDEPFCCQACTKSFRHSCGLEAHWYLAHSKFRRKSASTQQNQILDKNVDQEGSPETQELPTELTTKIQSHFLTRSKSQQRYHLQSVEKMQGTRPIAIAPPKEKTQSSNKGHSSFTSRKSPLSEVTGKKMIAKGSEEVTRTPVWTRGIGKSLSLEESNGENEENVLLLGKQVPMHCSKPGCVESFDGPVQYWAHFRSKHWSRVEGHQYLCMTCWQLFRHYGKHRCDYLNNNLIVNICPYCGQLFKSIQPLRKHTMVCKHVIDGKAIKCYKCATSHHNIDEFCFHLVGEHADGFEKFLYVCKRCGVSFKSCDHHSPCFGQSTWFGFSTVPANAIACPSKFCSKYFSEALAVYEHYRDIHWEEDGGFRWLCTKCGSMASSKPLNCCASPSFNYLCLYCGEISSTSIKQHTKICLGCFPLDDVFTEGGGFTFYRRQLQCMFCKNKYDRLADIALHVFKEHCKFSPAPRCWFCRHQGRFPDGIQLWQHMIKHHLQWSLNQKYLCVCCGSSFTNLCLVNKHQVYTHGFLVPIRHICSCCGNLFDTKDAMEEHRINCLISTSTVTHSAPNHNTPDPVTESEGSEEAEVDNVQIISSESSSNENKVSCHEVEPPRHRMNCIISTSTVTHSALNHNTPDPVIETEKAVDNVKIISGASSSNENEMFCHEVEPLRHSKSISSMGKSPVTENPKEEFSSASFICPHYICERSYTDLEKMWKHYQDCHWEASNKQSYLCTLCGKPYTNAVMMNQHNKASHSGKASSENLCTFCGDRFDSSDELDRHTTKCSKSTNICPQCGKHLPDLNNLHLHIEHHKNDANETSTDQQSSEDKSDKESSSPAVPKYTVLCNCCKGRHGVGKEWTAHLKHCHSGQNLRCTHCSKVFAGINNIKLHMKTMHKELHHYMISPRARKTRNLVLVEEVPPVGVKQQSSHSGVNSSRVFKTNTIEHCTMCTKAFINLEMLHKHMANVHKNVSGKTARRKSQLNSMREKVDENVYVRKQPELQNVRNNASTLSPSAESITPKPVALVHNRAAGQSEHTGLPFTPPIVKSKVASDRVKDGEETKEDLKSLTKYWSVGSSDLFRKDHLVDGVKTVVIAPTYLPEEAELNCQPLSSKSSGTLQDSWLPGQPLMETSLGGRQEGSGLPAEVPSVVVVKPEPEDDSLQQAVVTPNIASDQDFLIPQIVYKQRESSSQFKYEHGLHTADSYGNDFYLPQSECDCEPTHLFKQDLQYENEADLKPPSFQCDQALPDPSSQYEQGLNTQHCVYGQSLSSPCAEYEEGPNTPHQTLSISF